MAMQLRGKTPDGPLDGPLAKDTSWNVHHALVLQLMAIRALEQTEGSFEYQMMHGAHIGVNHDLSAPAADILEMLEDCMGLYFPHDVTSNHGRLAAIRWLAEGMAKRHSDISYTVIHIDGFKSQACRALGIHLSPGLSTGVWTIGETADIFWVLSEALAVARTYTDHLKSHDLCLLEEVHAHFSDLVDNRGYAIRGD